MNDTLKFYSSFKKKIVLNKCTFLKKFCDKKKQIAADKRRILQTTNL